MSVMDPELLAAASRLDLRPEELTPYGRDKAKLPLSLLDGPRRGPGPGRLVLVSAITPTTAGEGKTTTAIGAAQGLQRLGERVCLALRQPSLGPCLGMKGGATGGGLASLTPSASINLHFTGDFHAITTAHNLLVALLDNHLHQDNALRIDPRRVLLPRVMDMNDRALRQLILGLGGPDQGVPREAGFEITAASEVMAAFCLSASVDDLRARLGRIAVAFNTDGALVRAADLGAVGAMMALLHEAVAPNLVRTLDGVPALVHGGPFANIAHGTNSVLATRLALHLSDWVLTEAGFGFDLGGEKYFDLVCPVGGFAPAAVVLVVTTRALRLHGGAAQVSRPDAAALGRGLPNLERHLESVGRFGRPVVVALNRFPDDSAEERALVARCAAAAGVAFAESEHFARGAEGAEDLARALVRVARTDLGPAPRLYADADPAPEKIRAIARQIYGADEVQFTREALADLRQLRELGLNTLPVCMAKTQYSLSDDPRLRGRPQGFTITVRRVQLNAGAGFLVVLTGELVRMPGLPESPQALRVDVVDGRIVGVG